jgi:hypothetical protein
VSNTIIAVGVPAADQVNTVADFVAAARAAPGKFNATAGPGFTDFVFDYFAKTAGLNLQKVPYRDTVQAATDLGEGRLQIYMSSYAILRPQTDAGRIKLIAVNGRERVPTLPNIPTVFEAGFPSLEYEGLVGLFGLKTMSKELNEKIAADIIAATKDPAVTQRFTDTAQVANPGGRPIRRTRPPQATGCARSTAAPRKETDAMHRFGTVLVARRDDVRLDHSIHWPVPEPRADLGGGHFGRFSDAVAVAGLDLAAQWGSLTVADGRISV